MPAKYAHINFTPPKSVQAAAKRGLELRRKYGRGGLSNKEAAEQGIGSGVQRGVNLSNGDKVSPETIKRMVSFFARHRQNKDSRMDNGEPGAGMISWAIWGGDPGDRWANKVNNQMKKADEAMKNKSLATLASQILTVRGLVDTGAIAGVADTLMVEKIGARHTSAECQLIQDMHDLTLQLGAECHPLTRRAGAKHSVADHMMIQRIHDDCAGLGAECKALPERDPLHYGQVMKEGEVSKAQADAPNYLPASTPQRCEICAFFRGDEGEDYCTRFEFTADPDYVCDDWQTAKPDEIPGYVAAKADLARLTEGIMKLRGLTD